MKLLEMVTGIEDERQLIWVRGYLAALEDHNLIKAEDIDTIRIAINRKLKEINDKPISF
ncbi:MAG: hypothetical protein ACRC26_01625 [Bacteroidales bacterium]